MIWITWNFLNSLDDATQFILLKLNMEEKKKNTQSINLHNLCIGIIRVVSGDHIMGKTKNFISKVTK